MKFTTKQLRKIIKEELSQALGEARRTGVYDYALDASEAFEHISDDIRELIRRVAALEEKVGAQGMDASRSDLLARLKSGQSGFPGPDDE